MNITLLGATGSIGKSTLDLVARHRDKLKLRAVSAYRQADALFEICTRFEPQFAVLADDQASRALESRIEAAGLTTRVLRGDHSLSEICTLPEVDTVVTGIVGAAGLVPTVAAVESGKRVLIANKEPLVMMGREIVQMAGASGATLIPLDSEHNAIFQCLPDQYRIGADPRPMGIANLLLTASGGPFRRLGRQALEDVTPEQAINHPNWSMGPKISVDSASLMNKGLELIEACVLFGVSPANVRVVIHPQSTIHSMVEFIDGSVIAQLGSPDMRIPIAHGLGWPERISSGAERLDLFSIAQLDFEAPDVERFPCLRLAQQAAESEGTSPVILSAANEVAVAAFLKGQVRFTDIPQIIEDTLNKIPILAYESLEQVLEIDEQARACAGEYISTRAA